MIKDIEQMNGHEKHTHHPLHEGDSPKDEQELGKEQHQHHGASLVALILRMENARSMSNMLRTGLRKNMSNKRWKHSRNMRMGPGTAPKQPC